MTLRIREAQTAAFLRHISDEFLDYARTELRARWPDRCSALGEAGLVRLVREASLGAAQVDAESYFDACRFVELTLVFGRGFEAKASWARASLGETAHQEPQLRLARLWERALEQPEMQSRAEVPEDTITIL